MASAQAFKESINFDFTNIRGKFNKEVTNRDLKETNGDNDKQTTFVFQCNLQTNLNTCPTVSLAPGNLCRKILVVAV